MECFPACVTCTGLCKREVPVAAEPVASKRRKPYVYPHDPYIVLECGHYTDRMEQNVMQLLDSKEMLKVPRRKKNEPLWCGHCQQWVKKRGTNRPELPREPMF